jgi:hypothetical protein
MGIETMGEVPEAHRPDATTLLLHSPLARPVREVGSTSPVPRSPTALLVLRALPILLALPTLSVLPGLTLEPLEAQAPRDHMAADWERHRTNVVNYVEAMPESGFGFRPTPDVRTFAEQIEHIVTDHVGIVGTVFHREDRPDLGDPERYLQEEEALLAHVHAGYDWVLHVLEEASDLEILASGEVFGRYRVPRWQALQGALEHGTWTLGQTVPYLRLSGVTPPPYVVFPLSTQVEGWRPPG